MLFKTNLLQKKLGLMIIYVNFLNYSTLPGWLPGNMHALSASCLQLHLHEFVGYMWSFCVSVPVNICLAVELIQTCQPLKKENLETCDKKSGDSTFSPINIKQTFFHLGY